MIPLITAGFPETQIILTQALRTNRLMKVSRDSDVPGTQED